MDDTDELTCFPLFVKERHVVFVVLHDMNTLFSVEWQVQSTNQLRFQNHRPATSDIKGNYSSTIQNT